MELILQKVCGRPAQLPIRLRRCGPADAAAFFALQNEVRAAMPHPEQFVPDTLENITAYLREGLCIGAYDGERLGAYFILRYCGRSAHNYAAFLGVPREEWEHWANADSAVVHPDWRPAAEAAGSGAASCPARHRGHRGHRQPGESIQPEQCPCLRFCHCRPPGDVRRV